MKVQTPAQAMANRTARIVRENKTPVYSTSTPTLAEVRRAAIRNAERALCTPDYCFVCGRATDHFAEHSDEQLLGFANTPRGRFLLDR